MANSLFIKADEVAELLGVSRAEAYRIIKRLNDILLGMKSLSLQRVYIIILSKPNTAHPYYFMRKH